VVALGRKNYLFAGSDAGGECASTIYSLIGTAKLNGIDPEAYLRGGIGKSVRTFGERVATGFSTTFTVVVTLTPLPEIAYSLCTLARVAGSISSRIRVSAV
jgi:hypothetical protein